MNSRKADRRRRWWWCGGGGQVVWLFTLPLTDLDNGAPATDWWLSLIVSLARSLCPSICFSFALFSSLSFFLPPPPPLLSLSHSLPLLVPSEFSPLAMAAKMHHHLSAAAHPPLTSRLLFSRQAGLKSQLRIEPSRLKPVSNQCSPPPPPSLQPQTCVAGYRRKMDEEQVPLLSSVP